MRHERQVLLPDWDQDALREARVAVVGCGALGSSLAISLVRLGVGSMVLIDPDVLEEHNLENQAYTHADLGKPKAMALKEHIQEIDSGIRVTSLVARIQDVRADLDVDVLFGCLDNVAARHYLNHIAITTGTMLLDAGIEGFRGVVKVIRPGRTACLSCHPFHTTTRKASCSEDPIPSTYLTANVVANLQAMQFLKFLHGWNWKSHISIDLQNHTLYGNHFPAESDCQGCGHVQR